jgi:hypothetical protein
LAPLASLSLAGQEHGRTIPLTDIGLSLNEPRLNSYDLLS